jgi:hypothetical protein
MKTLHIKTLFGLLIVFASATTSAEAFSGAGDGLTADTAFIITTCAQLQEMNNDLDAFYKLGNDIDCAASAGWNANEDEWVDGIIGGTLIADSYVGVTNNGYFGFEPIGQDNALNASGSGFTGTLDGQGNTVSDLWIFRKEVGYVGLIGYSVGGTIKNLTLEDAQIVGGAYTGGFVGIGSDVTLENLTNNAGMVRAYLSYNGGGIAGRIENTSTATGLIVTGGFVHGSGNMIGGLVGGVGQSSIFYSTSTAAIDGGEYIGGAFGWMTDGSEASYIVVTGSVESNKVDDLAIPGFSKLGRFTGGFAGYIEASTVSNVTVSGSVTADEDYAGGFAGVITSSSVIDDVTVTGNVSGNEYIGGFAGQISGSTIEDTVARGTVVADAGYTGGFVGLSQCGASYTRVAAYGDVTANGNSVGGFVGNDGCEGPGSTYSQVAAHGDVESVANYIGGFIGAGSVTTFDDVYASGNVQGLDRVGGFAGFLVSSNIEKAYSRGLVVGGDGAQNVGAFIGEAETMTIASSFVDFDTAQQEANCGLGDCTGVTPLSTADSKVATTYTGAGWNFEGIWEANADNDNYPHFYWEEFVTLLPGSGTQQDPYQVSACFTARVSGYYELINSISGVSGNCIEVEANNVYIDGAEYTISAAGGGTAIFSEGYDGIHISDIALDGFTDGIRISNNQGPSTITDVEIAGMEDDGIELRGVTNMTITGGTIIGSGDDGITVRSYYDGDLDEDIYNSGVEITNVTISNVGDFGIYAERVTGLEITENEISATDDDGIAFYIVEDVQILENTLDDIGSDGIYTENGSDMLISGNTISNVDRADGIDFDDDSDDRDNHNITVTNNTLTNIGDNGIEAYELNDATITGNTITARGTGFDMDYGSEIDFRGNTITPVTTEFYQIPTVATESVELDILDADNSSTGNYGSINYTLPFTFDFKGRDIVAIEVGFSGAVELLEDGELCSLCGDLGPYHQYLRSDTLFASFDALDFSLDPADYVAIFSPNDDRVVIEWVGTTQYDYDTVARPVHFQMVLYPNGEVQWNFVEMNFLSHYFDMFTGAYDGESEELYRAGFAINQPSSYRADFSGETEYDLTQGFDSIDGIDLDTVTNGSFIGNIIQADRWVTAMDIEGVLFNDNDSGNTYRLANGAGAWTVFDIVDTDGNGYAESGTARPFSELTLGDGYWNGEGEDLYPASQTTRATENNPRRKSSRRFGGKVNGDLRTDRAGKNVSTNDDDNGGNEDEDGVIGGTNAGVSGNGGVSTTRQLQRFLNTNGFPIAASGPGSLNNETDTFGELTRQALARFQAANGISPALGIFGPITKAFINKNAAPAASAGTAPSQAAGQTVRDLEMGASGADVTAMQKALIAAGFPIASGATGYFGQQTKDALIAYQKANNIVPASGYFGPVTRVKLIK